MCNPTAGRNQVFVFQWLKKLEICEGLAAVVAFPKTTKAPLRGFRKQAGPRQSAALGSGSPITAEGRQVNGATGQTGFSCALWSHTDIIQRAAQQQRCVPASLGFFFFPFSLFIPHHVIYIMFGTGASEHMTWPQSDTSAEVKMCWKKSCVEVLESHPKQTGFYRRSWTNYSYSTLQKVEMKWERLHYVQPWLGFLRYILLIPYLVTGKSSQTPDVFKPNYRGRKKNTKSFWWLLVEHEHTVCMTWQQISNVLMYLYYIMCAGWAGLYQVHSEKSRLGGNPDRNPELNRKKFVFLLKWQCICCCPS